VTVPTLPVAAALFTTSDGRPGVTNAPPIGAFAVGVASEPLGGVVPALCVTATVEFAMVSVADRAAPVFAATVYCTVPFPEPDAPAVMVAKVALLVAVHVQPDAAVTLTDPFPPPEPKAVDPCAATVYVHDVGVVGVVLLLLLFEQAATAIAPMAAMTSAVPRTVRIISLSRESGVAALRIR
jgi:hypothetical protein